MLFFFVAGLSAEKDNPKDQECDANCDAPRVGVREEDARKDKEKPGH